MTLTKKITSLFDDTKFAKIAIENCDNFANNSPFPHIVFDNFMPLEIASALSLEYPSVKNLQGSFKLHDHQYASRHFLEDSTHFPINLKLFSQAISSRSFLLFLETLSGIKSLIPDPYFMGGGAMVTAHGGFLNIHVDFNWHQKLQSWRRLNALFYLTEDWKEEWGGNLELWSEDGKHKVTEIAPLFNRVVIFSTTSKSFHGQPQPVLSPIGKPRRVFSAFYYSNEKHPQTESDPHFTRYVHDKRINLAKFETSPYAQAITDAYLKSIDD